MLYRYANKKVRSADNGAAIVEMAIAMPIILLAVAGVLNFWMIFTNYFHLYASVLKGVGQQIYCASSNDDIQRSAELLVLGTMRSVNGVTTSVVDDSVLGFKRVTVTVGINLPVPIPAFGTATLVGEIVGYDP